MIEEFTIDIGFNEGDVFELLLASSNMVQIEEARETAFFIYRGDKILVLEIKKKPYYKILVLTGKHTGRIGYEFLYWLMDSSFYRKLSGAENE